MKRSKCINCGKPSPYVDKHNLVCKECMDEYNRLQELLNNGLEVEILDDNGKIVTLVS